MRQYRTRHTLLHEIIQLATEIVVGGICDSTETEETGKDSPEQQGLSLGHWLLELQVVVVVAASAVAERADRARSEVTKRTMV